MAWFTVDSDGECIFENKPVFRQDYNMYISSSSGSGSHYCLTEGTIEKLLKRKLNMGDEPIEMDLPFRDYSFILKTQPKKLIRNRIVEKLKVGEYEFCEDKNELNKLYALKIQEELLEIQKSEHKDITEFADLLQVATSFAIINGFSPMELFESLGKKEAENGVFNNLVLTNLSPENPSNRIYYENEG